MAEKSLPYTFHSVTKTLTFKFRISIDKPQAPGHFWGAYHFTVPGTVVVCDEVLTLDVPKDKYAQVWSPNHKPVIKETDSARIYTWIVLQLVPAPKEKQ